MSEQKLLELEYEKPKTSKNVPTQASEPRFDIEKEIRQANFDRWVPDPPKIYPKFRPGEWEYRLQEIEDMKNSDKFYLREVANSMNIPKNSVSDKEKWDFLDSFDKKVEEAKHLARKSKGYYDPII